MKSVEEKELESLSSSYQDAIEEIERLNNIINGLERWLKEDLKNNYRDAGYRHNLIIEVLDKLKELKENNKDDK